MRAIRLLALKNIHGNFGPVIYFHVPKLKMQMLKKIIYMILVYLI